MSDATLLAGDPVVKSNAARVEAGYRFEEAPIC